MGKIKYIITFALLLIFSLSFSQKQSIMAIFAHPDDELTVAQLLSYYSRQGHDIRLVIATKGEKGTAAHAKIPAGDSLANVRAREAACACKTLGINPPVLLGLNDGELDVDFTGVPLHTRIDSVLRLYQPDIVITWGPEGGYGHLDHRMVHNVVTEIFQSGKLKKPTRLFYTGFPIENFQQAPEFKTGLGRFFFERWMPMKKQYLTTRIKYTSTDREVAHRTLVCHYSQFNADQVSDVSLMVNHANRDTAWLRPYIHETKISNRLK